MSDASLTLLLGGNAWHRQEDNHCPELPSLQTLLSKASRTSSQNDTNVFLCELFGMAPDSANAAVSALGNGLDPCDGWWLQADPVHMLADRDQLFLSASSLLGLSQNEADQLITELNNVYKDDGWQFFAPSPQHWYLKLPESLSLHTVPTAEAMGRRVGEILPQGTDAMMWQRVMTEVQMLLHSSNVNMQRSAEGQLTVNALWFWGGGHLPQTYHTSQWTHFVAEDPMLSGLARLHGHHAEHYSSSSLDELVANEGRGLWQLNLHSLDQAERELFTPLLTRLREGVLSEVVIAIPEHGLWHVDKAALRRWWRRRKPLSSLLEGEA